MPPLSTAEIIYETTASSLIPGAIVGTVLTMIYSPPGGVMNILAAVSACTMGAGFCSAIGGGVMVPQFLEMRKSNYGIERNALGDILVCRATGRVFGLVASVW